MEGGKYSGSTLYSLDLTSTQWDEIVNLIWIGDTIVRPGDPLPRPLWVAIAHACIGKAVCVEDDPSEMDAEVGEVFADRAAWADELHGIACAILDKFKPGDGQI